MTTQTQADLDALAAQITNDVNTQVPGGEPFAGIAYPLTFDVGDVNVENLGSLTDKDGNTWTLTMAQPFGDNTGGNQWWGGVQENGQQLWDGYNVALRLVNGDVWVEEAKFGGWWNLTVGQETNNLSGRPGEGGDPGQGGTTPPPPSDGGGGTTPPPPPPPTSGSDFITPGVGSFNDAAGNTYAIDAASNADENGAPIPGGSGTGAMEYANGVVYGQDIGTGNWYTWDQSMWSASAAPPAPTSDGGATTPSSGGDTTPPANPVGVRAATFSISGGTTPSVSETGDHGSLAQDLSQTGTYTVGGDTFVLSRGNAADVTLGTGTSQIKFVGASSITLTGGSGEATVAADAGTNVFAAGTGSLDVTGGGGQDAYVFHANSGLLTLEDFSLAKGDTLIVDKSLQGGSLHQASDGTGGTMLTFGANTGHGVDIHGLAALPSSNIVWA
jgi:hypothetical protein